MNIYISGISGTGMGPLALMAKNAGYQVFGSDQHRGAISHELEQAQIPFTVSAQDGQYLQQIHEKYHLDWFVHTSALPENHPELQLAKSLGLKISKRDELTATLVKDLNLKMIAVAGTHGKTTTTAMLIWLAKNLQLPAAYIVGSTLNFAPSGSYQPHDRYFIYEADEYDRNFLHYHPWLSLITFVSFDHPDIYPTEQEYRDAFLSFEKQSKFLIFANQAAAPSDLTQITEKNPLILTQPDSRLTLAGQARREDANLVFAAAKQILRDLSNIPKNSTSKNNISEKTSNITSALQNTSNITPVSQNTSNVITPVSQYIPDDIILNILNQFPGVGRRFERLSDGLYSDYAHHPEEIKATIEIAKEEAKNLGKTGVAVVYQPHQNTRQHEVFQLYKDAFLGADRLFWLPTYLTRENPNLKIYTPEDFISTLTNSKIATAANLDDNLKSELKTLLQKNYLVILMSAGPADSWFRHDLLAN